VPETITRGSEIEELARLTGLDLSSLPPIATTPQLAEALHMSASALDQDRHRGQGSTIPYVRIGRKIRYLRADVVRYLLANRHGGAA
jgi:hypothetical protein